MITPMGMDCKPNFADENTWTISITRPKGYIHSEAFREIAEALKEKFRESCVQAYITENVETYNSKTIILGAHLLTEFPEECNAYVYNLEKLSEKSLEFNKIYTQILRVAKVIDYCSLNAELLSNAGIKVIGILRIWYTSKWERIVRPSKPIYEVVIVGSITERRERIITNLRNQGIEIITLFGKYGLERDLVMGSCKAILNIHAFEEDQILEITRLSYLASNKIPFISEKSNVESNEKEINQVINWASVENMAEILRRKINQYPLDSIASTDAIYRAAKSLGISGFECIKNEEASLIHNNLREQPSFINLGCGNVYDPGMLNIDKNESNECDVLIDIESIDVLPIKLKSEKYGDLILEENSIDLIVANDFLEHVNDLVKVMTLIKNILKPGGMLKLKVPYDLSYGAWQDPTHKRAFNERSFWYYDQWCWYLGWKDFKLKTISLKLGINNEIATAEGGTTNIGNVEINPATVPRAVSCIDALLVKEEIILNQEPKLDPKIHKEIKNSYLNLANTARKIFYSSAQEKKSGTTHNSTKNERKSFIFTKEKDRPTVSLCTPTKNRQHFLPLTERWILEQDYPKEKIEWIIVDDSDNTFEQYEPQKDLQGIKVNYHKLTKPTALGRKRNIINSLATGDILLNIDDDDYYFPERISHAVDSLMETDSNYFAASKLLLIYFLDDDSLWISNPGRNICCAGSFAYKKELIARTFYDNHSTCSEEESFTNNFTEKITNLDENKTMICIAHNGNTSDKHLYRLCATEGKIDNSNLQKIDWFTKSKKNKMEWRSAYRELHGLHDSELNSNSKPWHTDLIDKIIK